ncbi:MAG: MFS transporter [bacterium]
MKTVTRIHQMMLLNVINIGIVVFWSVDGAFMTNYLTKKEFCFSPFGISDALAGVVLYTGQLMVVLGVLFGYWSDRTRTRLGKRRPYMLIGALICGILYCLLPFFNSLTIVIMLQIAVYFFLVLMAIPYYSLIPDTTPAEKLSTCNAFFSLFGAVGTIAGYAIIGGILCDQCKYPHLYRYLPFFATSALVVFFALVTVFTTREDVTPTETIAAEKHGGFGNWFKGLIADLKQHRDLSWFMVYNFFLWCGLQGFVKFFTRFMDNDMGVPLDTAAIVLGLLPIVVMLLAVPVGILGDKVNRKNLLMFGTLLTGVSIFAGYYLIPPNLPKEQRIYKAVAMNSSYGNKVAAEYAANPLVVKRYDYKKCLTRKPDPCSAAQSSMAGKFGMLKKEPLRTTAIVIGIASAGLCIVFLLMAAIAPTLMPQDKIGEYMGLLSATTGLGGGVGLLISGGLSTLLINSLHCRVIFIIGFICIAVAALVLLKVKIKNPWELASK